MKFQADRRWKFFLFVTLSSLWFSGYVQRELATFRPNKPEDLYDFHVYYIAAQVARSQTDRRLYSYKEVPNPRDPSKTVIVNPQLQWFDPDSTYGRTAGPVNQGVGQYLYPPFFSLTVVPLTYLPYEKAKIVFHVLVFLLACASIFITAGLLYRDYLTVALAGGVAVLIAEFTHPVQDVLFLCNISTLLLFLTMAGVWLHRKYPSFGALFFALATLIKLTPAVVVPLMIIRKEWRWLGAFALWSVLLLAVSVWRLGWQNHVEFATRVLPAMSDGILNSNNRSLSTFFYALWGGRFLSMEEIRAGAFLFPPKIPSVLFKLSALGSLGALLLSFWRNRRPGVPVIEILILTLWSIIFSPVSLRYSYALALAPAVYAWLHPSSRESASPLKLALLSAATFMIFSILPNYVFAAVNSFPAQLLLFLVMPAGVILCIWYLLTLPRWQGDAQTREQAGAVDT